MNGKQEANTASTHTYNALAQIPAELQEKIDELKDNGPLIATDSEGQPQAGLACAFGRKMLEVETSRSPLVLREYGPNIPEQVIVEHEFLNMRCCCSCCCGGCGGVGCCYCWLACACMYSAFWCHSLC
jgi:hypothetical protein